MGTRGQGRGKHQAAWRLDTQPPRFKQGIGVARVEGAEVDDDVCAID